MKAAGLGHQYLTLKSNNTKDRYFADRRFRGAQRELLLEVQTEQNEEQQIASGSASAPLSRRAIDSDESSVPSATILDRSLSDSTDLRVVYEREPTITAKHQQHDGGHRGYSLMSILSKRRGSRDDNDKLSSRVRKFYKKQDELIDSFEQLHNYDARETEAQTNKFNKQKKHIDWLIKATLVFNSSLLIAKIVAAVFSKSLSIISSVVDSAVDTASACLLFWALRAIKRRDPYTYPGGRTRLEPLIIVILSVIMVSASVQVIYQSVETLISDVNHFTKNSTQLSDIQMGPLPITVMCVTVVCKAALSFLCFRISNPTMHALALDHLNDVFSNIVALVCGLLAAKAVDGSIKKTEVVVIDPVGAIIISLYIIFCWLKQLREQVRNLSGYAAEPEFLQKITWVTLQHSPLIKKIDTVRAFHFGISFLVEVELILPETMTLKESHDIGSSLQIKLENLPEVELAFVRLDYAVDALKY